MLVVAGLGWCVSRSAWHVLDPHETAWMHSGDWADYYQAWLLHTRGPWTLQLGAIPGLLYPFGMSTFYTGANFWLCLVGKLVAPFFSGEFQLYGLFYLLSFVSQGLAVRWVLKVAGVGAPARVAGALLGLVDPVLMARMGHIALMAQAITVVQVGLALRAWRRPDDAARTARVAVAVAVFSVGIEAYLAGQAIPLAVAVLVITRVVAKRPWKDLAVELAVLVGGVLFMLWQVGAIAAGDVDRSADGFGQFSSDLLALFNSHGHSKLVPPLPAGPRQAEGYAYLGVGVLLLLPFGIMSFWLWLRRNGLRRLAPLLPLLIVALLMAVYAWSSHVTVRGQEVLDLEWAFAPFGAITNSFRTCGRFIWPLHYVVSLGVMVLVTKLLPTKWPAMAALSLAAGLQGWELNANNQAFFAPPPPVIGPAWTGIGGQYKHIKIIPIQLQWICEYDPAIVSYLTRIAARERMTINSGYVGRVPHAARAACGAVFTGPLEPDTLYVVSPTHTNDSGLANARCERVDGIVRCSAPR